MIGHLTKSIKDSKKDISNYKSIKLKTQKQEKEKEDLDMSGDNIKSSQMQLNISKNKSIMGEQANSIEKGIMNYEYDRINNNKLIMLHFINFEMAYHALALEELTKLFKEVKGIGKDENDSENDDNNDEEEDNIKKSKLSKNKKSLKKSKKSEDADEEEESDEEGGDDEKKKDNSEEKEIADE